MKKVKKLDFIANPKGCVLTNLISNKAGRIKRVTDNAIANIEDAISEKNAQAEELLTTFGDVADAGHTEALASKLREYLDLKIEAKELAADLEELKALKASFDDVVEVEEPEKK